MSKKHDYWRQRAQKVHIAKKLGVHWKDPLVAEALAEKAIVKVNQLPEVIKSETINLLLGAATVNLTGGDLTEENTQQIINHFNKVQQKKKAWLKWRLKELQNKNKLSADVADKLQTIVLPDVCPIFGTPLLYRLYAEGKANPLQASLDRINSNVGYMPGNVQVVSLRANILKRDASLGELAALGMWAARQLWGNEVGGEEGEFPGPERSCDSHLE